MASVRFKWITSRKGRTQDRDVGVRGVGLVHESDIFIDRVQAIEEIQGFFAQEGESFAFFALGVEHGQR
jgi:hypothetical protein